METFYLQTKDKAFLSVSLSTIYQDLCEKSRRTFSSHISLGGMLML